MEIINKILSLDIIELMDTMDKESIDLVLLDPPYGLTSAPWDKKIDTGSLMTGIKRILKPTGCIVIFSMQPYTSELVLSCLSWFRAEIIWNKVSPRNFLNSKKIPMRVHENILLFSPSKLGNFTYNPQMETTGDFVLKVKRHERPESGGAYNRVIYTPEWDCSKRFPTTIITFSGSHNKGKIHSTQKPVNLIEYLILTFSNPGDIVFDGTCGSGTTAIAATRTGRNYICSDINYSEVAKERVKTEVGTLFLKK